MKITSICTLVVVLVMFLTAHVFAGDFASLHFIGFSKDGRYMAFEQFGTQDGSGFPYSNIYFIDTSKNAFATTGVKVTVENESGKETTARARSMALAAKKLRQFGIVKGNTGRLVISHLMTDQAFDGDPDDVKANNVKFYEETQSMHHEGDYEINLTPVKNNIKACEGYGDDTFMIELKLTDHVADTIKLLQKDITIPASRGCALSYRIQDVYLYNNVIAVLMGVFTQGFEGPDMRFFAAAGTFK
ncbi:DUF2259 domain-containing protein [soil metagenome]